MASNRKSMKENMDDDESIKDVQVRRDIQTLSTRLYGLREKFMKMLQKIRNDASNDFGDDPAEKDDTSNNMSDEEMLFVEEFSEWRKTANDNFDDDDDDDDDDDEAHDDDDDNEQRQKSKVRLETQKLAIESILDRKARRHEYLKNILEYPNIMKYLMNDDPKCKNIARRHLEPFIKECVTKTPNDCIYDKVNQQLQDIRRNYLSSCE